MLRSIRFPAGVILFGLSLLHPCCPAQVRQFVSRQAVEAGDEVAAMPSAPAAQPPANLNNGKEDGSDAGSEAEPVPGAASSKRQSRENGLVGVGIRLSTLGAGAEVASSLNHRLNLRAGLNIFMYDRGFNHDGVAYNGQLNLRSGELHVDFFPFGHGFHLSPGLMVYNGNGATANASVPGGSTFTLGGTTYMSDPTNPIGGKGTLDFRRVAPTVLFGFGNLVPRSGHFSVNLETGVVFQGSARTRLNLTGNACDQTGGNCVNAATDPTVLANIQAEQTILNNKLSPFKYYPVLSIGFGYRF